MNKKIKILFPKWCKEENMKNIDLCLSDDIDSYFSCIILQKLFPNIKIKAFYNFNSTYVTLEKIEKCVAVDADLVKGRCWGNHVTLENKKSANLNTIMGINQSNYTKKFAGSTLLTILSYYNVDLSEMSEKQLEVLISIDVAFKQYFFNKELFKKYYNDILEYPMFVPILQKHDKDYFYNIIKEYNLHEHIYIGKDKQLHTNIRLDKLGDLFPDLSFDLPQDKFEFNHNFDIVQSGYLKHDKKEIFSCARTYKNSLRYSIC